MKPKINPINFKILTIFFSIVIISFSFQNAFASESSTIFYSDKKLTWDDFQGNILSFSPNYGAVTYSDIKLYSSWKYSETSECNYEFEKVLAKAWFDKEASFVRPWVLAGTQSNWILNHEQRHFDIAVIHAKKFNQQSEIDFMGKQFSCTDGSRTLNKSEINSISDDQVREVYDKIRQKLRFMQQDYDSDTHHASSKDVQREWNNKIDSELKRLEENSARLALENLKNNMKNQNNQNNSNLNLDFSFFKNNPKFLIPNNDEKTLHLIYGKINDDIFTRGFALEFYLQLPDSTVKKYKIPVTEQRYYHYPLYLDSSDLKGEYKILFLYKDQKIASDHFIFGNVSNMDDFIKKHSFTITVNCQPEEILHALGLNENCIPFQRIDQSDTVFLPISGSFPNNSAMPVKFYITFPNGDKASFSVRSNEITDYKKFYEYQLGFDWNSPRGEYTIKVIDPQHLLRQKITLEVGPLGQDIQSESSITKNFPKSKTSLDMLQEMIDRCGSIASCN